MQKLTDVLNMGGYAAYVWPSYAVAALVMCGMALLGFQLLRRARRLLASLHVDET